MTEVQKPVPADLLVKGKDKVVVDEPMDVDLGTGVEEEDDDLYTRLKTLQRQLEFYENPGAHLLSSYAGYLAHA